MRQVVRKKKQQKVFRFFTNKEELLGFLFLLLVIGVFAWLGKSLSDWVKSQEHVVISKLIITGERVYTTDDDLRQAILSLDGGNTFVSQNVDVVRNEILRLPWIKQVSVRKQWPDILKLHVVEYQPVAHWNDIQFLDKEGVVFNLPGERLTEPFYPYLYGPEGKEKSVLTMYYHLNSYFAKQQNIYITNLSVDERYSWIMTVNNHYLLELGKNDIEKRLQRFIDLYDDIIKPMDPQDSLIIIDLRYDSGMAVTKR